MIKKACSRQFFYACNRCYAFIRGVCLGLISLLSLTGWADEVHGIRGQRYCEVMLLKKMGLFQEVFTVYNTLGLDDCPDQNWKTLSAEKIKHEMDVSKVLLNGPRYWTLDGIHLDNVLNRSIKSFNGIKMREGAELKISILALFGMLRHYHEHAVHRDSVWFLEANKPIYELISPQGKVFVMQSYSTQIRPQTMASLDKLNTQLHLPEGWTFKTGIIKQPVKIAPENNTTFVLQDDFLNSYQLAPKDFLE
jgi:hypothetical protein